jgi:two-component system, cell cycle sensor histidine kinase and response regulator CckA
MPVLGIQPANLIQTVLDNVGVAVAVLDRQERMVFANHAALAMFRRRGETQPTCFRDWCRNYRFEDSRGREITPDESPIVKAIATEKLQQQDLTLRLPDGGCKWLRTWAHPFSAVGLVGVLAVVLDQTADVDLQRTREQLQRMETLATLAASLAHDFNNVLTIIASNVSLAMNDPKLAATTRNRIEQAEAASEKAAGLVKRLMEFSGTQRLKLQRIEINDVVSEVLRLAHSLFPSNISVSTDLQEGLPSIQADMAQLEQALLNLIVNAIDAMENGGRLIVSTSVRDRQTQSTNRESSRKFVVISVADTGMGIPSSIQGNIFEPFFSTKPSVKGAGLGLSSTYGIVRKHEGTIELESAPGTGTTFRILLPF